MAYLDKAGLTYFWNKIKVLLTNKSDKGHKHSADEVNETTNKKFITSVEKTKLNGVAEGANNYSHPSSHPASMITGLANVATSGSYKDLKNLPVISNKMWTGGATWYYKLGEMVIDDSGNYGNFTFTGRFGGWTNDNTATYSIMLMNRADYSGDIITSTVSASGAITQALNCCDIVVAKNSDKSHTVYLKCKDYFVFDFAYTAFQHEINYNGNPITEEPSNIIWRLSTAPKTILHPDGSFQATGGIKGGTYKVKFTAATTSNENIYNVTFDKTFQEILTAYTESYDIVAYEERDGVVVEARLTKIDANVACFGGSVDGLQGFAIVLTKDNIGMLQTFLLIARELCETEITSSSDKNPPTAKAVYNAIQQALTVSGTEVAS